MLRCGAGRGELNGSCQRSGHGPCARPSSVRHAAGRVGRAAARSGLTSDTSAFAIRVSLADLQHAPCPPVRLGIASIIDRRTQWSPLSAAVDKRSNAEPHKGTGSALQAAEEADRAE